MTARYDRKAFPSPATLAGPADPQPLAAPWPAVPPASSPTLPGLLSAPDIQALFNRSARTLRRWIRLGHLSPVRIGGAVFFRAVDIRRLIEGDLRARIAS